MGTGSQWQSWSMTDGWCSSPWGCLAQGEVSGGVVLWEQRGTYLLLQLEPFEGFLLSLLMYSSSHHVI